MAGESGITASSYVSGTAASVEVLQGPLRNLANRDAQLALRLRVARAAVPAAPDMLVPALLYLTQDLEVEVRKNARESLATMPADVLAPVLRQLADPALVDAAARALMQIEPLTNELLLNHHCADDTVRWLATTASPGLIDTIARNQVRLVRCPAIIEATYLNPLAPQSVVQGMFELAARSSLNLDHVPGFRETRAILMGEESDDGIKGLSDAEFSSAMLIAMGQGEMQALLSEKVTSDAPAEEGLRGNLASLIAKMSVAQKVRIAMVGDAMVRKLLIRDPKKIVAFAVLKSPRLTDGEIAVFAANKALSEDILASIARNRQWTKDYATRKALVFNPKTPLSLSLQFLRTLTQKDMKDCSGSRDVNQNIARAAKRMITAIQEGK